MFGIQMVKGRWLPNQLNTALVYYSQKHQSPGFACSEIRYPLYLDALKSEHLRLVFKWLGLKKRETQNTHRCATSSKVKNSNFECYKLFIAIKITFRKFIKVQSIHLCKYLILCLIESWLCRLTSYHLRCQCI